MDLTDQIETIRLRLANSSHSYQEIVNQANLFSIFWVRKFALGKCISPDVFLVDALKVALDELDVGG